MPNSTTSETSSIESEDSTTYLQTLINKILEQWATGEEVELSDVYHQLVEKAKMQYGDSLAMDNDDLWQDIAKKAKKYQDKTESDLSDEAAFSMAMKKYKPMIMEEISNALGSEDDDAANGDNMQTGEGDSDENQDETDDGEYYNQQGSGVVQTKQSIKGFQAGRPGLWRGGMNSHCP